jgi:hypothetical protein
VQVEVALSQVELALEQRDEFRATIESVNSYTSFVLLV